MGAAHGPGGQVRYHLTTPVGGAPTTPGAPSALRRHLKTEPVKPTSVEIARSKLRSFADIPIPTAMSAVTAQRAHDELLEQMPEGATHHCPLCTSGAGTGQQAKEVAEVADPERTFSETEHFALLTDAVARETAAMQSAKEELETQLTEVRNEKAQVEDDLKGKLDMLEAEKVAAEKAHTDAVAELEAFKTGLQELAEIETRKAERSAAVKEAAGELLDDEYVTEDRVQRWAEMSDEAFEAVLADFRDLAAKNPFAKKKKDDAEDKKDGGKDEDTEKAARTTAAFTGGDSPSAANGGSLLGQYLTVTGKLPATAN